MKHILFFLTVFLFTIPILFAQVRKTYTVMPGQKVKDALPIGAIYMYPEFKDGVVIFKNASVVTSRLNYNRLLDEIQFIDNAGDTFSLDNEETIASVNIAMDTFYYYQGFIKLLDEVGNVKFAGKERVGLSDRQKVGAMGVVTSGSIETYGKMSSHRGIINITPKEVLTFSEYAIFFIGDKYNHFKRLNKKSLLNMYANQQAAVEKYIKNESISFLKEDEVKKLIAFLKTL